MSQSLQVSNGCLPRVKTFCTGTFDEGTSDETVCTAADLQNVVANFKRLSTGANPLHRPPVAKGHEINGEDLLQRTDQPATGWVTDCWIEGDCLYTRWEGIPDDVAEQINSGQYRYPSAEFYTDPAQGNLPGTGWCLRRVAILGAVPPRNKRLGQLTPVAFGEDLRFSRVKRYKCSAGTGAVVRCFSEGTPMDRPALEEQLRTIGMGDAAIKALSEAIPDDVAFQGVVMALMAEKAAMSAGQPAPAATPPAVAAADMPPPEQMITDLLAAGVPQEEIDAVKDDPVKLYALWMEKAQPVTASEPNKTAGAGVPGVPANAPAKVVLTYSERALKARLDAFERRQRVLEAAQAQREAAERQRSVIAFCERWVRDGYVLPGDVDAKSKTPNLYQRLMNADGGKVKKFGERSLSDFDAMVAEIEARGPGYVSKFFSEKIADPADTNRTKQIIEERVARIKALYPAASGKSLEQRLNMLQPLALR